MNRLIQISSLIFIVIFFASCGANYKTKVYTLERTIRLCDSCENRKVWAEPYAKKSIVLVSDSTLNYSVIYGHIGSSTTIKYKISNDTLIMETTDVYGKELKDHKSEKLFANRFLYSADSLRNIENEERYYYNSNKKKKKGFNPYCLIVGEKLIKLETRRKAIRYFKEADPNKMLIPVNEDIAKIKYGIDKRYVTFKVSE